MELRAYLIPLRQWWWFIALTTLVATAATYFSLASQPPLYQARATLMIGRAMQSANPDAGELYLTQQLAATYVDLASRDLVRDPVMARLGLNGLPGYSVSHVADTQLMDLVVTDTNPQRAQAVANELANELARQTPAAAESAQAPRQEFVNQQLDSLEANIRDSQAELERRQQELAGMLSGPQIAEARLSIANLQAKLNSLQVNYASLLSNTARGATNSIKVVEPAKLPRGPIGNAARTKIPLAAAVGFALGAGIAFLLEYLDDRLKSPEDVEQALQLTTLGIVPSIDGQHAGEELIVQANSHTPATEAYRVLRTNLQFTAVDRPLNAIMVTSSSPSEGKSTTVANLGAALAQTGQRVILVDTDLHRPRLHRIFKLPNSIGVTSALLDEHVPLEALLIKTGVPGLRVMTSGPLPPNPAELLGSSRMRDLLERLKADADVLILDSPPTLALADAVVLAGQVDGVLLVIDAEKTRREAARRAVDRLRQVQARVVGAIMNRVPARGARSYYYYYYSHYDRPGSEDGTDSGSSRRNGRHGRQRREQGAGQATPAARPGSELK